jgi:hypothetical protein
MAEITCSGGKFEWYLSKDTLYDRNTGMPVEDSYPISQKNIFWSDFKVSYCLASILFQIRKVLIMVVNAIAFQTVSHLKT